MNKFFIYTGIILMTISFFIPTIMKSEVSFALNNNTFLTIFSIFPSISFVADNLSLHGLYQNLYFSLAFALIFSLVFWLVHAAQTGLAEGEIKMRLNEKALLLHVFTAKGLFLTAAHTQCRQCRQVVQTAQMARSSWRCKLLSIGLQHLQ